MTRFLLDTNVVSDAKKPHIGGPILEWLDQQNEEDVFISTFTIAEIIKGILLMPAGRKRMAVQSWFDGPEGPNVLFRSRILPFDEPAALEWAKLVADGFLAGKPRSGLDMIVAAIARANDCLLVTANERHFDGVIPFFNPMRG
ncbi:MAG TPA: PIN domain-containing protein [Rhizomicrobium sp.]|nr:PIN domain-containing protein [Rhizomicrobium sp.]